MPASTTLNENTRATLDGTEYIRLATSGANWKALTGGQIWVFQGIAGGNGANSTLTFESTTGVGTGDAIIFKTASQIERLRINNAGGIGFATNGDPAISGIFLHQFVFAAQNTANAQTRMLLLQNFNDGSGTFLTFAKSRGATPGDWTIVQNGDTIGQLNFYGGDNTDAALGAYIQVAVDGAPGNNDMPMMVSIATAPDGTEAPSEAFRISSAGAVYFPRVGTTAGGGSGARLDNATSPVNSLLRDTSSLRYKTAVRNLPSERIRAIDTLRPIEFRSLASADNPDARYIGYAAEEVAEIDPVLVAYDAEGRPDSVMYDRVNLLRTEALKLQLAEAMARIAELEARIYTTKT